MQKIKKVVLAYSGGLDTSVILKWLITAYQCEVITVTADLGQPEDLSGVEEKALKTGASKAYVLDLREEMARDFVFPMMRGAARYENRYMLGTSIARPCITKALIDIARKEGADAIAHGATGKGNDQVRFEFSAKALAPDPGHRALARVGSHVPHGPDRLCRKTRYLHFQRGQTLQHGCQYAAYLL